MCKSGHRPTSSSACAQQHQPREQEWGCSPEMWGRLSMRGGMAVPGPGVPPSISYTPSSCIFTGVIAAWHRVAA